MSKLIIDVREKLLKEHFESKENVVIKQLDLGDIIYTLNENPVVIIERKTISDLRSSIKDGRHREQKIRLLNNFPLCNIYYLIEGDILDFEMSNGEKDTKSIYGAVLNSLIRDNIKIIRTCDIKESIRIIELILHKLKNQSEIFNCDSKNESDYASTIKIKKKDNMNNSTCFLTQLSQIPGVSITISKNIIKHYSSMYELCLAYSKIEEIDECKKMLVNIEIPTNTGKIRKLGKVLSERIYNFICNK